MSLPPHVVQLMTAEALCESLIRTQREAQAHKERADKAEARVAELEAAAKAEPASEPS